jgi:hypothetical protein
MADSEVTYFEDLAATGITCPHKDAFIPDGIKIYYRVLKSNEVASDSFLPTVFRSDRPLSKECDACIQKSVSIYDDLQGMINGFFKTPANKNKKKHVGVFKLEAHDGMLKQTFGSNHHSWWRSKVFDVGTVTINEI